MRSLRYTSCSLRQENSRWEKRTRRCHEVAPVYDTTRTQVSYNCFDRISLFSYEIRLSDISRPHEIGQGEIIFNFDFFDFSWISIALLTWAWHSSARRSMTLLMRKKHVLLCNEFVGISSTLTWNLICSASWTSWISAWRSVVEKSVHQRDVGVSSKSNLLLYRQLDSSLNSWAESESYLDPCKAYEDLDSFFFF